MLDNCCCCPCWVLFSCFMSNGTAVASHQGMQGGDDRPNEITCTKCGLNESEASALSEAKRAEAQGLRTRLVSTTRISFSATELMRLVWSNSKGSQYFRTQAERNNLGLDQGSPPPPPDRNYLGSHVRSPSQVQIAEYQQQPPMAQSQMYQPSYPPPQ
ncbi:hypothetical protein JCM5353_008954 [Sporobolomyces roseus]